MLPRYKLKEAVKQSFTSDHRKILGPIPAGEWVEVTEERIDHKAGTHKVCVLYTPPEPEPVLQMAWTTASNLEAPRQRTGLDKAILAKAADLYAQDGADYPLDDERVPEAVREQYVQAARELLGVTA